MKTQTYPTRKRVDFAAINAAALPNLLPILEPDSDEAGQCFQS